MELKIGNDIHSFGAFQIDNCIEKSYSCSQESLMLFQDLKEDWWKQGIRSLQ